MLILFDIFLILFGGMFLYVGISALNSQRRVRASGMRAEALVIDFHVTSSTHTSNVGLKHFRTVNYHYPIVRFTDEDGIEVTQRLDYTISPNKLNQFIYIMYIKHDEDNYYEIIVDNTVWKSFAPQLFIGIGAVVSLIGIVRLIGSISN